jgi:hypothetical protein
MAYEKQYHPHQGRQKLESETIEVKAVPIATTAKKKAITGHNYFVRYAGPQLHLSISPGIGKVEKGVEYQVSEELYYSLKGLEFWTARTEEVLEQR